jgi:hypothetical protein
MTATFAVFTVVENVPKVGGCVGSKGDVSD